MLDAGASRDEIVDHLGSLATGHIGLSTYDRPRTIACVIELIEFWQSWKSWRAAANPQDNTLSEFEWHLLDATADDWESLDQIESHVRRYCPGISHVGLAEKIIELKAIRLLEEMPHEQLECEAVCADDLLSLPTTHWFQMTPVARMLWEMNRSEYTEDISEHDE